MGAPSIIPSEDEFRINFQGLMGQAKAHGVEITEEVRQFLVHEANVGAHKDALIRQLTNVIHGRPYIDA